MKSFFELNILPASEQLDSLMGVVHVHVEYIENKQIVAVRVK